MTQIANQLSTQPSIQPSTQSASNTLTPVMKQQLEQLRDIHLPEPVSWFPMAIGWWILIALIILVLVLLYRKIMAHRRIYKHPVYLAALKELSQLQANSNHGDDLNRNAQNAHKSRLAGDLSALLKRVGIYHNLPIATLTGDAWAQYLTQADHSEVRFNKAQADFIAHGAYMDYSNSKHPAPDWQPLETTARNWITEQFKQSAKPTKNNVKSKHNISISKEAS